MKNEMKSEEKADAAYGNFEWHTVKAVENLKKHKISFEEAAEVFNDPFFILFNNPDHSFDEERFIIIGMSEKSRYLFVSFSERERIRIISARELTAKERRDYENKNRSFDDELREEYNLDDLEIKKLGDGWKDNAHTTWAVCIDSKNDKFVPLKLYKIEIYPGLSRAKAIAENGCEVFCPTDWFIPVEFEKNAASIFEEVAL